MTDAQPPRRFKFEPSPWHSVALLLVGLTIFAPASAQAQQACTREDEHLAPKSVDMIGNWRQAYESFRRYGQCDDGGIAEGYSDTIVGLLVDHWESFGELSKLSHAHPEFERFVIKHVDMLMSPDESRTIIENAQRHCPAKARAPCDKLEQKARNPD
jgi:hypothetical protein